MHFCLGTYLGMELLDQKVRVCSFLVDTASFLMIPLFSFIKSLSGNIRLAVCPSFSR